MITLRPSNERGAFNHGWLDTRHTFSFARYIDRAHMGFGPLRVINEDVVKPGMGFDTHGHKDMEIVTYILEGALEHKDSLGTGSVIRPGEIQRMSAGTGIRHSEFNHSREEDVHLLQIWILPERDGVEPGYEQVVVPVETKRGRLQLIASRDGGEHGVTIHQDVDLYAGLFDGDETAEIAMRPGRLGWLQVARGEVELNGRALTAGDGAAISDETQLTLDNAKDAEVLFFDMARI